MSTDPGASRCTSNTPFTFGGSASEPTATLTRIQAVRAFHDSHPEASVQEIIEDLCRRGLEVDEQLVREAIAAQ
jgi:hypothetical protein